MRIPSVSRGACQGLLPAAAQPTGPMTPRRRGSVVRFRAGSIRTRSGTPGRPQSGHPETFCDGAMQVCRTMWVRFGRPPRQTAGPVESPLKMAGLDRPVPDFPTRCRRQARIAVQVPFRGSADRLRLRVDSKGVKFRGEWRVRKHGPSRRGQWRKAHIASDAGTGDIRAVDFTSSRQGGSPPLPELLSQIAEDEDAEDEASAPRQQIGPVTRAAAIARS